MVMVICDELMHMQTSMVMVLWNGISTHRKEKHEYKA